MSFVWKNQTIITVLLLNPMAMAFYQGTMAWFDERPAFTGNGLPSHEAFNLDRKTRCYRNIGGCVVYGGEWVYHDSHNAGLKLMTIVFGLPPKTYHGPYPTFQEATNATANAVTISVAQFETGKFEIDGRSIQFGSQTIDSLVSDLGMYLLEDTSIRVAIWQNECLVIHLQSTNSATLGSNLAQAVYLFQVNELKPLARHVNGNGFAPRIPRLLSP
ncbi:MAG: hypothetical protein ACO1QS_10430 [Verrucomicrobiota bacterium]